LPALLHFDDIQIIQKAYFELKVIGFAVMRVIGALFLNETPLDCTNYDFGIPF
jgi:hypothetical protein